VTFNVTANSSRNFSVVITPIKASKNAIVFLKVVANDSFNNIYEENFTARASVYNSALFRQ
jgi:hypothetical protein